MADASFKREFLNAHNAYRSRHSAPALVLNSDMCAEAQRWANNLLQKNTLMHSKTNDGENVYAFSSSAPVKLTGREAVDAWYSEIKYYSWNTPGYSSKTGHFTQVVWKDSEELGVGIATNGKRVFVVGQYRPAGNMNMPGYFNENVLPKVAGADNNNFLNGSSSGPKTTPAEPTMTFCCTLQ